MEDKKILQIIPAGGWRAVYAVRQEDGTYKQEASPLVCWALIKHPEHGVIVEGMESGDWVDFCEDTCGFLGYIGPEVTDETNCYPELLRLYVESEQRRIAKAKQTQKKRKQT